MSRDDGLPMQPGQSCPPSGYPRGCHFAARIGGLFDSPESSVKLRIRSPKQPPADRDLGPALARLGSWDAMRVHFDVALSAPRRKPLPVDLQQP